MKMTSVRAGWIVLLLLWSPLSLAHIHLERSSPAEGETVAGVAAVELWFSGRVAAEWSRIEVRDGGGRGVEVGDVSSDAAGHLRVGVEALAPGPYEVRWNVVAGDGHRIKGTFSFTVE